MLCQHCKKNPAEINFIESVNGSKFECHLCAFCYADLYGEMNSKVNSGTWAGLFSSPAPRKKICPVCHTTYADYERTGLLGCTSCYDVFKEELLPSILRIHGKVQHVGVTGKNRDELGLHRRLNKLQEQLEHALREQNFRQADVIYREINAIKKTLKNKNNDDNGDNGGNNG